MSEIPEVGLMVPTNWDPALLSRIADLQPAYLYGSLPSEATLRSAIDVPLVTEELIEEQVQAARELGIAFVYVMNATCTANRELTEAGRFELLQRFEWLSEIGAGGVVLSNPFVMDLLRHWYPQLELHVSVLAEVNSVNVARYYRDHGADVIHLSPDINRSIPLLRRIREAVDCRLSVLVNEGCVFECPLRHAHALAMSHSAESMADGSYADYCYYACSYWKGSDPVELIRAPWIRPQDLDTYADLGVDLVKVAGREKMGEGPVSHTDWIVRVARAYAARDCEDVRELLIAMEAPMALNGSMPADAPRVTIDARRLDGFLKYFADGKCTGECYRCGYCAEWTQRAVTVKGNGSGYLAGLAETLERLAIGDYRAGRVG